MLLLSTIGALSALVRAQQTLGDLGHNAHLVENRASRRRIDNLLQVLTGQVLHGQEKHAAILAEFVDGNDVFVVKIAGGSGFRLEADQEAGVAARGQNFDRHQPVHGGIQSEINLSKAPFSELISYFVLADSSE